MKMPRLKRRRTKSLAVAPRTVGRVKGAYPNRVREARLNLKLTQKQLADLAAMGQPHLSRIENGYWRPTLATQRAIAGALAASTSTAELRGGTLETSRTWLFDAEGE